MDIITIQKSYNDSFISMVVLVKGDMFEVLWCGKSVGIYNTEQEAENVAENYALGSSVSRT